MISAEAATLAVKVAKGLIKLANRTDLVIAEKTSVEGPLALVQPDLVLPPPPEKMAPALRTWLEQNPVPADSTASDLLAADRAEIEQAVDAAFAGEDVAADLLFYMKKYLPEQALGRTLQLNSKVMKSIAKQRPDWDLKDPDLRVAAFYISPGRDERERGYTWRIALTVVDVLAEFGAENADLLTEDKSTQDIVKSVLRRFADADLDTADSWGALTRSVLRATLNGLLDAKDSYDVDEEWVELLLDALDSARAAVPENKRDEFLLGLLKGRGYPLLVGTVLETAAKRLNDDAAEEFELIAADVLAVAAEHFKNRTKFSGFLKEHWTDLLQAGLKSLSVHGSLWFEDESPLVQTVVSSVVTRLAETPHHRFVSGAVLGDMVDAAVGAVAAKPELIDELLEEDWLRVFVRSVTSTVADQGVRDSFSREGLESIVHGALASFAEQPELIIENPGIAQELLGGVLQSLKDVDRLSAESMANAGLQGALSVLAKQPELAKTGYPELVASLASKLGSLVAERSITRVQGADLLQVVVETVVENRKLFIEGETALASAVVDAVLRASDGEHGQLLTGAVLVEATRHVVAAMASSGAAALSEHPLEAISDRLFEVVDAGLTRASRELGHRLRAGAVPHALGALVSAWARGEVATIDPSEPNFKRQFAGFAAHAVSLQGGN